MFIMVITNNFLGSFAEVNVDLGLSNRVGFGKGNTNYDSVNTTEQSFFAFQITRPDETAQVAVNFGEVNYENELTLTRSRPKATTVEMVLQTAEIYQDRSTIRVSFQLRAADDLTVLDLDGVIAEMLIVSDQMRTSN